MADTDATAGSDSASSSSDSDTAPRRAILNRFPATVGFDAREAEAAIAGGLAGAFQAGLVIQLWDADGIREIGAMFGVPTLDGGWVGLFVLGVAFAFPFTAFVSNSIDAFVMRVMSLSSRSKILQKLLVPLLRRSALATTTYALGNGYGVLVGVLFSLFLMPAWLAFVMGVPMAVPNLTLDGVVGVVAWIVYGGILGLVYGLILES